jgi:predicted transcriptional regulator of viral defense system
MSKLKKLLTSGRNIFTLEDMSVIWGQKQITDTSQSAKQYARRGELSRLRRGVYVLPNAKPTPPEIASKIVNPSYLTGESVLKKHASSFQFDNRITSAALISKRVNVRDVEYVYYKLDERIFFDDFGVFPDQNNVMTACFERAIADLIYITGGKFAFEDLTGVDWDKLNEIGKIYGKKSVLNNIAKLKEKYA